MHTLCHAVLFLSVYPKAMFFNMPFGGHIQGELVLTCFVGRELKQPEYLSLREWAYRKGWMDITEYHAGGTHGSAGRSKICN